MRVKTNLLVGLVFVALLTYVYVFEVKEKEKEREAAEQSNILLDVDADEARQVTIARGDSVLVAQKRPTGWRILSPVEDVADEAALERFVRNLKESKIERVVADSAEVAGDPELATKYGLRSPRLKIRVDRSDASPGTPADTLLFGNDSPTEKYVYVMRTGTNPEIFTVRAWRYDNLNKGLFDLRDRRVLSFLEEDVQALRLERTEETVKLERVEGSWQMRSPVDAAADESAVEQLLGQLKNAKIKEFVDESARSETLARLGFDAPLVTAYLTVGEDRAEKKLTLARKNDDGRPLALDGSRSPVFAIDSTLVEQLLKSVFDLREKNPIEKSAAAARKFLLHGTKDSFVAEKDSADTWGLIQPAGLEGKPWKLANLIRDLKDIEVRQFVHDGPAALADYGLENPTVKVELLDEGGQSVELRLGNVTEDGVYLTRMDENSIYLVDRTILENVDLALADVSRGSESDATPADEAEALQAQD